MNIEQDTPSESIHSEELTHSEEPVPHSPKKPKKEKKSGSSSFAVFLKQVEEISNPDEKLRLVLEYMRDALAQSGHPKMKDFWEARQLCANLFKENLSPKARAEYWAVYLELSGDAKRLKELMDEQGAFAAEQLDLAIQALENDLSQYEQLLNQIPQIVFPLMFSPFKEKQREYSRLQRELNLLNTQATRITSLRKEIIKTQMRLRQKNQFFERLSASGDKIFPRRKDLIKEISQVFTADVQAFSKECVEGDEKKLPPLFVLREEIKTLQNFAKELTLNTHAFTETRERLSQCWDRIKLLEKERRKEFAEKKQIFKQQFDVGMEKIKAFADVMQAGEQPMPELKRLFDELRAELKTLDLGREEISLLKGELRKISQPLVDHEKQEQLEREQQLEEGKRQAREKLETFKQRLQGLVADAGKGPLEELIASRDEMVAEYEKISLSKGDRMIVDRLLKQIRDLINEKKDQAMLTLSDDELRSVEKLKFALEERKAQRQEIKEQLKAYRKALGGSELDFEKAMAIQESVEIEKARLDKIAVAIEEIEEKIAEHLS
jgi:hypothetical protein